MKRFSPLLSHWHGQVKQLFTLLHGHQKKVLALFVLGAIRAESIVVARVAEELLTETEAKVPSIERRLQRFLSNERIEVEPVWEQFLAQVLPSFCNQAVTLILDITPFEEYAQVVYVGLLQQARVLPVAWKVMPGQQQWEQGQWEIVAHLFERVARLLGQADCTLIADRGLSCLKLIELCQAHGWHYVLRIKQEEYLQRKRYGSFHDWQSGSQVVSSPGQSWFGTVRLWKEHAYETQLSAVWEPGYDEAWFLISDRQAGRKRVKQYGWRMRVESTFQDMKRRGWQWESSHVRQLDHLERLLLVLFLAFWWLMHLAALSPRHFLEAQGKAPLLLVMAQEQALPQGPIVPTTLNIAQVEPTQAQVPLIATIMSVVAITPPTMHTGGRQISLPDTLRFALAESPPGSLATRGPPRPPKPPRATTCRVTTLPQTTAWHTKGRRAVRDGSVLLHERIVVQSNLFK